MCPMVQKKTALGEHCVPEDFFTFANCVDPDKMPPYATFHLGLHCLPKYMFTSIQNLKG